MRVRLDAATRRGMLAAMKRSLVALAMLLGACGGANPNPAVPPPSSSELAGGGVWVAYNLGCTAGCDKIRRGDRIVAVDGVAVTNGAEFDAANLARGTAVDVRVARYDGSGKLDVQLVASPRTDMPPLKAVPPLLTVGAAALDRAPEWARLRLFGHAIPALRLYRGEEPRGYINGRELYGRGAVIMIWELPYLIAQKSAMWDELPGFYAQLQKHDEELLGAGVDTFFVFPTEGESRGFRPGIDADVTPGVAGGDTLRYAVNKETRDHIRSEVGPEVKKLIPLFYLESATDDPNNLGLEHPASDIREWLFDRILAPVILVIDHRGIVRWHSRDFPLGPEETIEAAVQFAIHQLPEGPVAPRTPAPAPAAEAVESEPAA